VIAIAGPVLLGSREVLKHIFLLILRFLSQHGPDLMSPCREQGGKRIGEIGLQPGVLLSAKDNYDGESYDYSDYVKTIDLSIPLGVGYDFPNNFGIGLRGTYTFKGKDK
jgi:hypothetical protein